MERRLCRVGRTLAPQGFDEIVGRDDLPGMQEQVREQGPLLRARRGQVDAIGGDLSPSSSPNSIQVNFARGIRPLGRH